MDAKFRHFDAESRRKDAKSRARVLKSRILDAKFRQFSWLESWPSETAGAGNFLQTGQETSLEFRGTTNIRRMNLSAVYSRIVDGDLDCSVLPAGDAFPYLTAMSIFVRISGVPLVVSGLEAVEFSRRYPKSLIPKDAEAYFK
ncbi:hypothetical protein ACOI1H_25730, partial [Loktanella sp. DJP18]|uniref:hypothetical protein n=1 Tax=Loktanella sp. DJP18 TaxID=3409788 RepID=UPI003BB496B9